MLKNGTHAIPLVIFQTTFSFDPILSTSPIIIIKLRDADDLSDFLKERTVTNRLSYLVTV